MSATVALIIVTHNSERWLPGLAASWIAAVQQSGGTEREVVIADSGSTDATVASAARHFPAAKVITLGNVGFGTAANRAAQATEAEWLLLCNADITFAPDFLSRLEQLDRESLACVAPRLLNPDGSLQASVGAFPTIGAMLQDQFRPRPLRKFRAIQPGAAEDVDWATGACLLLRRNAFLEIGGFDEKYFLYVEEVDLQRRLRAAGHRIRFEPSLVVTHHQPNASRPPRAEVQRYAARGMLRYFAKFGGGLTRYRLLALLSGRLPMGEALASRPTILKTPTGP